MGQPTGIFFIEYDHLLQLESSLIFWGATSCCFVVLCLQLLSLDGGILSGDVEDGFATAPDGSGQTEGIPQDILDILFENNNCS